MTTTTERITLPINNRQLADVTADVLDALYNANHPPFIFIREGQLVRIIEDERGIKLLEQFNESSLRGLLTRKLNIDYVRFERKKQVEVAPPLDVVKDILTLGEWRLPPIAGIIETPVVRKDATILNQPGYDELTHLYYAPDNSLVMPDIPEHPTVEQLKEAVNLVTEPLIDFPFDGPASYANAVAILITPQVRPMIDGCTPLGLFDKPQPGTGAGLMTDVVATIATGRPAGMMTAKSNDDEWRKSITSTLLRGETIAVIDNLEGSLFSSSLASVLTARIWKDRLLGSNKEILVPNNASWIATGNNVRLAGDLPRRCIWVKLDAKLAQPWLDRGKPYKHPHLLEWVRTNRGAILAAILICVRAWVDAGKPEYTKIVLGSFESWCKTIGGILGVMGITDFLENTAKMYEVADIEVPQWRRFLEALKDKFGDNSFRSADVINEMANDDNFKAALPETISAKHDRDLTRVMGIAFRHHKDVRYPNGLMLQEAGTLNRAITYHVVNISEVHNQDSYKNRRENESYESSIPTRSAPAQANSQYGKQDSQNSQMKLENYESCQKIPKKLEKLGQKCPDCGSQISGMWVNDSPQGFFYYCEVCYPDLVNEPN